MTLRCEELGPKPLIKRLIGALELAPMTVDQLAIRLTVGEASVRTRLAELRELGVAGPVSAVKRPSQRPRKIWSLAA